MMRQTAAKMACVCVAIAIAYASCVSAQSGEPIDSDAEVTPDGLYRVDRSLMPSAWIKPAVDLTRYKKVFPTRMGMSFNAGDENGSRSRRRGPDAYPVSEDRQQEIRMLFGEALQKDFAALEHFQLWNAPGPDVLKVEGVLLDVTSYLPLERAIVDDIAADITWEATLVVQIRDSMTDELLARAAERFRERAEFGTSSGNWIHTQQVIRRWSQVLCDRLEDFAEIGRAP